MTDASNNSCEKFESFVNNVRTELLKWTDKEMQIKLRDPFLNKTKINSESPRIINYCKENNFSISFKENFCSSRVSFNENSLKNVKIKSNFKNTEKKPTLPKQLQKQLSLRIDIRKLSLKNFNLSSNKNIPNILPSMISNKNLANMNYLTNIATKFDKNDESNYIKHTEATENPPESPSIKILKGMTKKNITKKSVFKETVDENLTSRNKAGSYLDDPMVFLRIKDSFQYIRSLPYIKKKKLQTPEQIIKEQEEFLELEDCLLIKDNIDEKSANKLKIIKEQTRDIGPISKHKNLLHSIHHSCLKSRMLSPISKVKKSSQGSNLFLLDLRSAHDCNFKLDLEGLKSSYAEKEPHLLTEVNRRVNDSDLLDLHSEDNASEDDDMEDFDLETSIVKRQKQEEKVRNKDIITMDDIFDNNGLNKTIC